MKKLLFILTLAICLTFAVGVNAQTEQPTCPDGQSYVGEYVESQTCNRVCTWSFFGICLRYENRCTTTGNWVGTCVADEEPEEPTEPTEPVVLQGDSLWAILASYCEDNEVEYTEWSKCNPLYNLQFRDLKRDMWGKSIFNGCTPTAQQQIDQARQCGVVSL